MKKYQFIKSFKALCLEGNDWKGETMDFQHPDDQIMSELIERQWTRHSIQSAIVNPAGKVICFGETT